MRCPRCERETPADAEFCPACGCRLGVDCAKCGTANAPDRHDCRSCGQPLSAASEGRPHAGKFASPRAYTPKHLAEKILTSRSALEGERKQVTVLFVDVSEFTELSTRLDPEDVHRLMTEAFELMLAEVHRYEGTVNQFLGDGIMALFGAPIGHEDHAERAVHAALGIRAALTSFPRAGPPGVTLAVRQGLNTGLVVVGSIGNDLRMDYTAVGDTTNVAARLQQAAEPGRIVISAATQRLVSGYFDTRPLGLLSLKGKTELVGAWEVVGRRASRTRLEVRAEQGLTPFVGREQECRALFESFTRVCRGQGQVVLISGEPGIGKSRLLLEFHRRLDRDVTWLEGHCLSFGRSIAFHPLIDLLKRNFRIEDGDAEEAIIAKIERGVLRLGEDLRPTLPYFRSLLSIDPGDPTVQTMDPRQRRGEIFNALRLQMERAAEIRPQVLVLEDLHWMDKATEEYLVFAADSVPTHRVLCILTYRTGYAHPLGDRSYATRLGLGALSADEGARMATALWGTHSLPGAVEDLIMAKTEGNPFFVEEVVKSLREVGVLPTGGDSDALAKRLDELSVPDTVHDVIASRIDRLDERSKRTLQTAAIIGREFSRTILERTMELGEGLPAQVDDLKRLEFIFEKRFFPEPLYRFGHSLTQEVAYEGLLMQRRQELHGIVARVIEASYGERLPEQYPVLAHHYSRTQDAVKAVEYLVKAGDRAVGLYANAEGLGHYSAALAQLDKQPPSIPRAQQRTDVIMRMCGVSGSTVDFERDLENLGEALRLAREIGDRRRESQVLYWTGRTHYLTGRPASGTEYAEQALALADELGDDVLAAMPVNLLGRLYFLRSDFEKNVRMLERSAALFERDGNRTELATARGGLGWSLAMIGQFERALREADASVALAEEVGHLPTEAACRMYRACAWSHRGEWRRAIEDVRRSLSIAERVADAFRVYLTTAFLGGFLVMAEDVEEGLPLIERALQAADRLRTRQGLGMFRVFRAEADLAVGDVGDAERQCRDAITLAGGQGDRWCEAWARRVLGETLLRGAPATLAEAEQEVVEAIRVQREIGTRPDLARSLLTHGRILARRGEDEWARDLVGEAARMFSEMGMTWDLARAGTLAERSPHASG